MFRKFGLAALLFLATSGLKVTRADFLGTMIGGHADIGVAFDGTGLDPHIHKHDGEDLRLFGGGLISGEQEFAPADLWIGVPNSARLARPAGSQWDFLGNSAGQDLWVLLPTESPDRPFIGFAAEELVGFSDVTITIQGITGRSGSNASTFSVFKTNNDQTLVTSWASSTGVNSSERQFTVPVGGHDHWFMAFTGEGVFDVSLNFAATDLSDSTAYNSTTTFTFAVGDSNFSAVPEPTSMALLACCGTVMIGVRKWRKNSKAA